MARRRPGTAGQAAAASLRAQVARSLDSPAALLPHLPELLTDLSSLGTTPRRVTNWLAAEGLGRSDTVIDLGCGKGAAAIEAAARLGCCVEGVDAFEPFVLAAREEAARRDVAGQCRFVVDDYRRVTRAAVRSRRRFAAGLMLSVAPVDVAADAMHRLVKAGGIYAIDDAVWVGGSDSAGMPRAGEARKVFMELGDEVLREHVFSPGEVRRMEERAQRLIAARARRLAQQRPRLWPVLREMLAMQRRAVQALTTGPLRPALWMVRRGGRR